MTTAHKPTWNPAKGGSEQGGNKVLVPSRIVSVKDQPALLTLKRRRDLEQVPRDRLKANLIEKESTTKKPLQSANPLTRLSENYQQDDITSDLIDLANKQESIRSSIPELPSVEPLDEDKDDSFSEQSKDEDSEMDELMKEYEKIKEMRKQEQRQKDLLKSEQYVSRENESVSGFSSHLFSEDYSLKRKWYDDTVFKNQAKKEKKPVKRFINDTVRSDFHRKFMYKSIQ